MKLLLNIFFLLICAASIAGAPIKNTTYSLAWSAQPNANYYSIYYSTNSNQYYFYTNTVRTSTSITFRSTVTPKFAGIAVLNGTNQTANVTLEWDVVNSPYLAGYALSYGMDTNYITNYINTGLSNVWTVTDMPISNVFYFSVQSYNVTGQFSDPCTPVVWYMTIPVWTNNVNVVVTGTKTSNTSNTPIIY